MKKSTIFTSLIIALTILILPASATFAENALDNFGSNYDVVVLTPNHSRTIYYELPDIILNDVESFQATFIMTIGAGTLTVGVANSSNIGEGSELIYATAGLLGFTPVLDYSYSSAPISITVDVPGFSIGFLITSVIAGIGGPDFPITMSMTFSLY